MSEIQTDCDCGYGRPSCAGGRAICESLLNQSETETETETENGSGSDLFGGSCFCTDFGPG